VGTTEGLEATMVPAAGLELVTIPKVPLPRRPGTYALRFPGLWRQAMRRLDALLREFAPDAVVGFGGYTATPVYRAAFKAGLPVVVHEANARPGLANRYGAKHAAAVGVAFPGTPLPGAQVVGMPLRRELADLNRAAARAGARAALGLDPDRPTLLVSGGSLGALRLNRDVVSLAPALLEAGTQVLHLTGRGKAEAIRAALSPNELQHYHIREYLPQMEWALAAADLAVQRAGAGTVSELACAALPAVLVPLDVGNGEQRLNAAALTEAGGAVLVSGAEVKDWATQHLVELLTAPDRLEQMAQAAGSVAIHDGAQQLVELIRGVCR
jgi:UDP-N-acetylglucosamine:LPS N-acetylglucosamine transferase